MSHAFSCHRLIIYYYPIYILSKSIHTLLYHNRDNIYKEKAEPVLVLLSDLYSEEEILVYDSRPSSYSAYMFYLLLLSGYYPNKFYMILS